MGAPWRSSTTETSASSADGELLHLNVYDIDDNPFQPRKDFDPAEIKTLADSLREHDMLQPILVRESSGRYQLISGERRLRAAIEAGAVITQINGVETLSAPAIESLLRNQAGKQVLVHVRDAGADEDRQAIVVPARSDFDLRYHEWEYTRRTQVDDASDGEIGYVHLRAMGGGDRVVIRLDNCCG